MKIAHSFEEIPADLEKPIALTIGTFDGLHKGHQLILQKARELGATVAALTFTRHPVEVLSPGAKIPMICSGNEKIALFEKAGVDLLLLFDFTPEFADTPYDTFLKQLRSALPFSALVLGDGATFGRRREGTPEQIAELGEKLSFTTHYLSKIEGISSKQIRNYLQMGKFADAENLLGRPYTLLCTPEKVKDEESELGDHVLLCTFQNPARLPSGHYHVDADGHEGYALIDVEPGEERGYITLYTKEPLSHDTPLTITPKKQLEPHV